MKYNHVWFVTTSMLFDDPLSESDELIWNALKKMDAKVDLVNPLDIGVIVSDENIRLISKGGELKAPDYVIVRKKRGAEEHTDLLVSALKSIGVELFEHVSTGGVGKVNTILKRKSIIPIIPTAFSTKDNLTAELAESIGEYPFIVKPKNGFRGKNVIKVDNREEFEAALSNVNEEMIVQKYIDVEEEYRVMVIDGKSIGIAKKNNNAVVKNAALGSVFEKVENSEAEALAVKAASLQEGRVYGVDIVKSRNDDLLVVECNRAPEFLAFNKALNISVEELILDAAFNT